MRRGAITERLASGHAAIASSAGIGHKSPPATSLSGVQQRSVRIPDERVAPDVSHFRFVLSDEVGFGPDASWHAFAWAGAKTLRCDTV